MGGPNPSRSRWSERSTKMSGVTAPTQPSAPDPTAVVGRRFGAVAIDLGILWVFSAVYWVLASEEEPGSSIFVERALHRAGPLLQRQRAATWPAGPWPS